MTTLTVNLRDIDLVEEVELSVTFGEEIEGGSVWRAALDGRLPSGVRVALERTASTSAEALLKLEAAITENGWEIR